MAGLSGILVFGWLRRPRPAPLKQGDKAPDFTLPATTAEKFSLSQFQGKSNVVLFGFIGAFTPT